MSTITSVIQLWALSEKVILADKNGYPVWRSPYNGWCTANGTRNVTPELIIKDGAPLTVLVPRTSGFEPRVNPIGEDTI